jgi:hypothetical protein
MKRIYTASLYRFYLSKGHKRGQVFLTIFSLGVFFSLILAGTLAATTQMNSIEGYVLLPSATASTGGDSEGGGGDEGGGDEGGGDEGGQTDGSTNLQPDSDTDDEESETTDEPETDMETEPEPTPQLDVTPEPTPTPTPGNVLGNVLNENDIFTLPSPTPTPGLIQWTCGPENPADEEGICDPPPSVCQQHPEADINCEDILARAGITPTPTPTPGIVITEGAFDPYLECKLFPDFASKCQNGVPIGLPPLNENIEGGLCQVDPNYPTCSGAVIAAFNPERTAACSPYDPNEGYFCKNPALIENAPTRLLTPPPTTTLTPTPTPPPTTTPTPSPTPSAITNVNNNQVTVQSGRFVVQDTTGAVTTTPDCLPESATIVLGPSPMQSGGARILAALDPCVLTDGGVVLNIPDEQGIQVVAANIQGGQTTQSVIVPMQRIAPITEGQTLYTVDLNGQITGQDPATGAQATLNGNINALFLLNAGGQNVELSADNSAALNAVLS